MWSEKRDKKSDDADYRRELSRTASNLNFTCKIDFLVWFGSLIIMRIGPDYLYHKMKCNSRENNIHFLKNFVTMKFI